MQLLSKEIMDFVNTEKLGFIATVCPDGTPNLSPKETTIAWDSEHLAFADIHSPGTINNLQENPSIEINIVDIFSRKGYRFKGTAEILSQGPVNNIVLVKVNRVLPILSPAYDTKRTESEIRDWWIQYWHETNAEK